VCHIRIIKFIGRTVPLGHGLLLFVRDLIVHFDYGQALLLLHWRHTEPRAATAATGTTLAATLATSFAPA